MSPKKRGGRTISRRMALVLIGGGAVGSLGVTGAFSSVKGPRRVDLGQKDDDAALLRLVSTAAGSPTNAPLNTGPITYDVVDGDTVALIDVTNAVGEDIDFTTVALNSSDGSVGANLQSPPATLSNGDTTTLEATITCPSAGACGDSIDNVSVNLDIVAEGPTTVIDLTRTLEVSCRGSCVPCNSGEEELAKYEWKHVKKDGDGDDDGDDDDDDDDSDDGGDKHSKKHEKKFVAEHDDSNISHESTTLDDENEPSEATFSTDYCSVDAVVKAGPNEETYENVTCDFVVNEIDDKAISHVRFYCNSPTTEDKKHSKKHSKKHDTKHATKTPTPENKHGKKHGKKHSKKHGKKPDNKHDSKGPEEDD